jgi:cytochrome c oxidase cbb3-type subunit III
MFATAGMLVMLHAQTRPKSKSAEAAAEGQKLFASNCAACHGLDGRGGERAPNIAKRRDVRRLSDGDLSRTIQEGIPGTGMPAFRSLGKPGVAAVVSYLRVLQGGEVATAVSGNSLRGKKIFFGKGRCSDCHMAGGQGGFIATDLSAYAHDRGAYEIRSAILEPNRQDRSVIAITQAGDRYAGIARNEDNFSLQLQALDGTFHFLMKSELRSLEYQPQSLMPFDYGSTLTSQELDDIIGFLIQSAKSSSPAAPVPIDNE